MFGSVRRLAFNSDDMSISVSSWRKLFIAVSLIALDLTYFFRFIVFSEMPRFTIHGRWSDIWLYNGGWNGYVFLWGVLQNIWSMRLQECLANLVGNVILGKKLFVHIKSKNSPNFSRSEICNKFILKSPTIAAYVFSLWSISIIGETTNSEVLTLLTIDRFLPLKFHVPITFSLQNYGPFKNVSWFSQRYYGSHSHGRM